MIHSVAPWSKRPNRNLKRTGPRFSTHAHQKHHLVAHRSKSRFVIFARRAPKMSEKSWRETIGVKVRSEILPAGQNFLFWPIWCDVPCWHRVQSAIPTLWLQSATPELRIRFGTLRQWCVKFLTRIFYSFWTPHSRKLRIGLFDHRATKIFVRSFWPLCDQERPQKSATNGGLIHLEIFESTMCH